GGSESLFRSGRNAAVIIGDSQPARLSDTEIHELITSQRGGSIEYSGLVRSCVLFSGCDPGGCAQAIRPERDGPVVVFESLAGRRARLDRAPRSRASILDRRAGI